MLPSEASEQRQDQEQDWLTLTVTADGQVEMEGERYAVSDLAERLQGRDATVLITGEADAPLQAALATLDAARAAGIEDVQLELMP